MSSVIHGGDIYRYGTELVDFSSNINPLGLPDSVKDVLRGGWEHLQRYPDLEYRQLRQAITGSFPNVGIENIIVGNGAAEIIYLLGQFFNNRRILLVEPTFGEYREAVELGGGSVETVFSKEETNWAFPLSEVIAKLPQVDGIWLGHPNNPTGQLLGERVLEVLMQKTQQWGKYVILDEAFIDFTLAHEASGVRWLPHHSQLFVIRAFTKWYALPGLRLGYGLASSEWVEILRKKQIPWSVNSLAAEVGIRLVLDTAYDQRSCQWIEVERPFLIKELSAVQGLTVYPTMANFILCKIDVAGWSAARLQGAMLEHGVLIRDARSFVGLDDRYFRVAIKQRADNERMVQGIKECILPQDA